MRQDFISHGERPLQTTGHNVYHSGQTTATQINDNRLEGEEGVIILQELTIRTSKPGFKERDLRTPPRSTGHGTPRYLQNTGTG